MFANGTNFLPLLIMSYLSNSAPPLSWSKVAQSALQPPVVCIECATLTTCSLFATASFEWSQVFLAYPMWSWGFEEVFSFMCLYVIHSSLQAESCLHQSFVMFLSNLTLSSSTKWRSLHAFTRLLSDLSSAFMKGLFLANLACKYLESGDICWRKL